MLEELAALWRPDLPVEDNPAYLAKAREQAALIETALRGRLGATAAVEGAAPSAGAYSDGATVRRSDIVASQQPPH